MHPPAPATHERAETRFAILVTLAYVVAAGAAALVHEPWRDETHAWLIARDATGPLTLLRSLRYEGHPGLWHTFLWPLTRLGGPALMQPLAVAFGAGAVFVFGRFAPFPRACRALFAFGYLPIWEWGAIARNYGMGVLLVFVSAALLVHRERRPVLLGFALGLAANTSAVAALTAGGLVALLLVERLSAWRQPEHAAPPAPFWCGIALAVAGIAACALQVIPPSDSAIAGVWSSRTLADRIGKTAASPVHGLASIPWPSALDGMEWLRGAQIALAVLVTLALTGTAALVLSRRRAAWIAAALPAAALLSLFFFRYYGGARHAGFLLVSLLIALWVAPSYPPRSGASARVARLAAVAERRLAPVLAAAFAFQMLGAAIEGGIDGLGVYSAARPTADLIRASGLSSLPIVGDPDFSVSNVIAWLDKPGAFYVNVERWGSFDVWDSRHSADRPETARADDSAVFAQAAARADGTDVLVVINREPPGATVSAARARYVGSRIADIKDDESYWVYVVPRR